MKKNKLSILVLTAAILAYGPHPAIAGSEEKEIATSNLASQKESLYALEDSLKSAKAAKRNWTILTVSAGVLTVLTAIPSVVVSINGAKNLIQGERFFGDPDSGGKLLGPFAIASAVIPVAIYKYGVKPGYARVQMRTSDIEKLLAAVEEKKSEIANTEALLESLD